MQKKTKSTFIVSATIVIALGFFSCQDYIDQERASEVYYPFNYYLEFTPNLRTKKSQILADECEDSIRIDLSKIMVPKVLFKLDRDTSEISRLLVRMDKCNYAFDSDPIYYFIKSLLFKGSNDAIALENSETALDLFKLQEDTSGMVNILYQIITLPYYYDNPIFLDEWGSYDSNFKELTKKSSNKRDRLMYYKYMLYKDLYNDSDTSESKYLFYVDLYEKARKIILQDTALLYKYEYEYFINYMNVIEYNFGNIEKSHEYAKKAIQLPQNLIHYPTYFNYSQVFDINNDSDSMYHYTELGYKKYLESGHRNCNFESYYHDLSKDFMYRKKNYEKAWDHQNLKDSIDEIIIKTKSEKDIISIRSIAKIEIEKLKVNRLNTEVSYLVKSSSILFLLLAGLIYLLYKLRQNKEKLQQNLEFKENVFRMISHDMLSPLHALQGYVSIIKNENKHNDNFNIKESLDIVSNNINQLDDLAIKTIGYLWKTDENKEPATLGNVFKISLNVLEIYLKSHKINLINTVEINKQDVLIRYPLSIASIIRNIITNIAKHTNSREVTVSSKIVQDTLTIEVNDNATPLTQNEIKDLANIIYNNKDSKSEIQSGTGLRIIKNELSKTKSKLKIASNVSGNIYSLIIPLN